jgi:hypothetical protein
MALFLLGNNKIFISHSSDDDVIVSAVKQAFDGLDQKPYFLEDEITGTPPVKKLIEKINDSDALFAFLTPNASDEDTRDWIVFEIGVAATKGKKIHAWHTPDSKVPPMLKELTTYRSFELTPKGVVKLTGEVKTAVKKLYSVFG